MPTGVPTIVVHGGAGVINRAEMTPEREARYIAGLEEARDIGYAVLEKGGSSLDAVTAAVRVLRARRALKKRVTESCGTCADHGCVNCTCRQAGHSKDHQR